ncbi:MAG: hypothetical protein JXA15_00440 [Spirochaetales bacterium]|nr:hypothetical protein [Spirochaetales bacterium]
MKRYLFAATVLAAALIGFGCDNGLDPVEEATLSGITASPGSVLLYEGSGETATIAVSAAWSDGSTTTVSDATWESDSTATATVADGVVTPVAAGTATVTATWNGKTAEVPIEVAEPAPLFADATIDHYVSPDESPAGTETAMIAAWEGSGSVELNGDGSATATFSGYPQWWGAGVAWAQKPTGAVGYYDLSGVTTVSFQIRSETILPSELKWFMQWLGSDPTTGGEYSANLGELGVVDITNWTTVTLDISAVGGTTRYGKSFIDFSTGGQYVDTAFMIAWGGYTGEYAGSLTAGESYMIRDIAFLDGTGAGADIDATIEFQAPLVAPADPAEADADVISIFTTKTYSNVAANVSWHPSWKGTGTVTDVTVDGKNLKQYALADYDIIEMDPIALGTAGMTYFHIDVWSPDMTQVKVKLVDFGADGAYGGGDDTEKELAHDLVNGEWVSLDIPLADFQVAGGLAIPAEHFKQLVLSPAGTIYVTNIYFHK